MKTRHFRCIHDAAVHGKNDMAGQSGVFRTIKSPNEYLCYTITSHLYSNEFHIHQQCTFVVESWCCRHVVFRSDLHGSDWSDIFRPVSNVHMFRDLSCLLGFCRVCPETFPPLKIIPIITVWCTIFSTTNYHGVAISPVTSFLLFGHVLPERYTSSVCGFTLVIIAIKEQIEFRLAAKVTYFKTPCPGKFYNIYGQGQFKAVMGTCGFTSTAGHSCLLLSFNCLHQYNVTHKLPCGSLCLTDNKVFSSCQFTSCSLALRSQRENTLLDLALSMSLAPSYYSSLLEILSQEPAGRCEKPTGLFLWNRNRRQFYMYGIVETPRTTLKAATENSRDCAAGKLNFFLNAFHGDLDKCPDIATRGTWSTIRLLQQNTLPSASTGSRIQIHSVCIAMTTGMTHASAQKSRKYVYYYSIVNTRYHFAFQGN